ncbi:exodeoxyribonuclease VII small subunit [Desulforegula conservatrix]|uniref:exodeoxyribonuclease VII small subunit n=1 Tax=Desulforegula conservatrix TaxID=153026 RepID=UPI0003F97D94|nr:exodeoxyribonuclease VII small subunit [Desulforegula conservatrix]
MTKKNFEQSMKDLEKIVEELESGEIPLEKALKKFEDGIKLSNFCAKTLDETEAKITMLIRTPEGEITEEPFTGAEDES